MLLTPHRLHAMKLLRPRPPSPDAKAKLLTPPSPPDQAIDRSTNSTFDDSRSFTSSVSRKMRSFKLFPRRSASQQHLPTTATPAPSPAMRSMTSLPAIAPPNHPPTPALPVDTIPPRRKKGKDTKLHDIVGSQGFFELDSIDDTAPLTLTAAQRPITRMPTNYWFLNLTEQEIISLFPGRIISLKGPPHSTEKYYLHEPLKTNPNTDCILMWASPIDPLLPIALLVILPPYLPPTPAIFALLGTIGVGFADSPLTCPLGNLGIDFEGYA
ncbi:hypothetical protein BC629DRAFT_1591072 [Irpex lacteus]|nr:hypothetical protein BC629DRAFT_1591072 [Irpex lacteus]